VPDRSDQHDTWRAGDELGCRPVPRDGVLADDDRVRALALREVANRLCQGSA
jgi:hypothetical protein